MLANGSERAAILHSLADTPLKASPRIPEARAKRAIETLEKYGIVVPSTVSAWLSDPRSETPKPGDSRFARVENRVIMSSRAVLAECARTAEASGPRPRLRAFRPGPPP